MTGAFPFDRRIVIDACPLCGGTSWTTLVGGPAALEWVRCSCALVFKRSEPVPAGPQAVGPGPASRAGAPASRDDSAYFRRYARRRRRRIAKSRRQILDALDVAPPGRLLDVGCSLGYTLEAAHGLGLDATGVDVSEHAVAECRRLGLSAGCGTMDALPAGDASFAIAMLKHVFEHTPAPRAALAELRRVLVPGAAVFFAVPDAGYFKAVCSPGRSRFFRGEAGRAHFIYYSPATLSRLLEEEGFRIEGIHRRLVHRRAGVLRRVVERTMLPFRIPLRALAGALGLRKEFWLVAVRT